MEKKNLNENLKEFRQFQNNIKKKAMLEKYKPANISKKEYDTSAETVLENLENNIFANYENNEENKGEESKIDISELDRNSKINLIKEFIYRKNIFLDETEINKIENIIDNPEIQIKKYINISKMYQQITKILNVTEDYLREAIDVIRKLNPKPGGGAYQNSTQTRITDFLSDKSEDDDEITVSLNDSRTKISKVTKA
ncbi:MAG: hypothetical protein WCI31_16530 [Prolixibacteraceae bacterium]